MNVLNQVVTAQGQSVCAEISPLNGSLWTQFWETRTTIWTQKYPEKPGPDGLEKDNYDASSSFVVLIQGSPSLGQVVAGCRLIHATDGSLLPVGTCVNPEYRIIGRAVEVSRFFFAPADDTPLLDREQLLKQFIHGLVVYLKGQGYDRAYATIRASLFKRLQEFGVPMDRIGPDQGHGVRKFIPARMFEDKTLLPNSQSIPERMAA